MRLEPKTVTGANLLMSVRGNGPRFSGERSDPLVTLVMRGSLFWEEKMETKIINGVECVKQSDYLAAPDETEINHVLVDMQDGKTITHEKMNVFEKDRRNKEAEKVGETFLVWCPAIYA